MKQKRTAEEIAALVALREERAKDDREAALEAARRVRRRAKLLKLGDGDLVRALALTPSELTGLAQDRIRRILRAIISDDGKLAACEKTLSKAPRGWDRVETSVEEAPIETSAVPADVPLSEAAE